MITLRHYLLTIVSVFLALAVGVVLGGGPLSDVGDRLGADQDDTSTSEAETAGADFREAFVESVGPRLVGGVLQDRRVAIVSLPGADEQAVAALEEGVTESGGTVSGRFALSEASVDPAQKSLVDTLGTQLVAQQPDGVVSPSATTYDRFGELLGSAVGARAIRGAGLDARAKSVLDSIVGADLVVAPEAVEHRAPLVLVVLGEDAQDEQVDAVLGGLVAGLTRQSRGVVVVGSLTDGDDGQLARLRSDAAASDATTVDGIDVAAGRTASLLALSRALTTKGGSFGASGEDGPVPLG